MDRRSFLGRLVMGAAAALGVGMAAPKAEAAQGCPDPWCPCHFDMSPARAEALKADFEAGFGTWSDVSPVTGFNVAPKTYARYSYPITSDRDLAQAKADAYERGRAIELARIESRLAEGLPIKRGALTFDEMAQDCAALGCSLHPAENLGGSYIIIHGHPDVPAPWPSFGEVFHSSPLPSYGLAHVDAWRRSLHGTES